MPIKSFERFHPLLFPSVENGSNITTSSNSNGKSASPSSPSTVRKYHYVSKSHLNYRRFLGALCRIICFDVPLFFVLSICAIILHIEWVGNNYLIPQIQLQKFDNPEQSLLYYHRVCTKNDQTTMDTTDLLVDITNIHNPTNNSKVDVAVEKLLYHGVTIIPNLMSESTASKLRDYIIEQNTNPHRKDFIDVIESDFRYSFGIQVDEHPIIAVALEELLRMNPDLVTYLEAIMGTDPAVVEFTAISQVYGAVDQYWHEDVVPEGSATKYGRSFVPTYNLFIPLQNVTAEMGATWICPGTHMCSESLFCSDTGFQVSGPDNNLPFGYGLLLSQQLTHRGGGHRDPNGPQRVILMLTFASRPRVFNPYKTVETRKIGLGGSYSQHFSQWGHTLYDYQQPLKYMKKPYRMLRSLGLYNNRGNHRWGWDYVTVCTGRLADGDYTCPSVREIQRKIKRAKRASLKLYTLCMAAYILYLLLCTFVPTLRLHRWSRYLIHNVTRLGAIHLLILLVSDFVRQRITDSTWGHNIHAKRSFRVSNHSFSLVPSLPATLPEVRDILIFEEMSMHTTTSYARTLEVAHPGNNNWNKLVQTFAQGYDKLSSISQEQIRRHILNTVQQDHRRILVQNNQLNWTVASNEICNMFSHKKLLQMSNLSMNHVIQSLDDLFSDLKHGYWRSTALHQKHIVHLLTNLQSQIIGIPRQPVPKEKLRRHHEMTEMLTVKSHGVLHKAYAARVLRLTSKCAGIPCMHSPRQSYSWLKVGDIAEATVGVDEVLVWYRCTIISSSSDKNVWGVLYDDGVVETRLCRSCVRPFVPYTFNETIDVLVQPDYYTPCIVKSIHQDRTGEFLYDLQLEETNKILLSVSTKHLRRNYRNVLTRIPVHSRVIILLHDESSNFPNYEFGVVIQYHISGNTYDVLLDDGEILYTVPRHHIKFT